MLPFSIDQFFEVFVSYNWAVWPAHVVAYLLAFGLLAVDIAKQPWAGRAAFLVLGGFWFWNGIAYHFLHFAPINPAAYAFAALFVVQGALFIGYAILGPELQFSFRCDMRSNLASLAIAYALLIYSLIGYSSGHGWPRAPLFGVAPCPTVIFTLGVLMLSRRPIPCRLVIIPFVWALIGSNAALLLGVPEDLGLLAFGATAGTCLCTRRSISLKIDRSDPYS